MSHLCLCAVMAPVRALRAKAREISFGPLLGGLPAACFATWSAFSFSSTSACPGHWIVGRRPWVCNLLAMHVPGSIVLDLALAGCVAASGVQQDSDWSLISHLLCYLKCSNNSQKLCIKDLTSLAQWEPPGLPCSSWLLPSNPCPASAIL